MMFGGKVLVEALIRKKAYCLRRIPLCVAHCPY